MAPFSRTVALLVTTFLAAAATACGSSDGPGGFGGSSDDGGGSDGGGSSGDGALGGPPGKLGDGASTASNCTSSSPDVIGCACAAGQTHACYTGPPATRGMAPCHDGTQSCQLHGEVGQYGPCTGEVVPTAQNSCGTPPDAGSCMPTTCAAQGAQCGTIPDSCGGILECPGCMGTDMCGRDGNGRDNVCLPALCNDFNVNSEPEIVAAYAPGKGQTVNQSGQIKVWVTDECPPDISPIEQLDPTTGAITMPGNHTAMAPDGYLWEPALYIAPQTAPTGTPHFPTAIKGTVDNNPTGCFICGFGCTPPPAPPIDPPPPNAMPLDANTAEYIWDVSSLGLGPGTYTAEFVIHDGDVDRGVGCVEITIGN